MTDRDLAHREQIAPDPAAPNDPATPNGPTTAPAGTGTAPASTAPAGTDTAPASTAPAGTDTAPVDRGTVPAGHVPVEADRAPVQTGRDGGLETAPADRPAGLSEESERVARPGDVDLASGPDGAGDEPAATPVRRRVSTGAVIGTLLAAVGLCGALTGLLAPEAFVVAIVGGLLCLGGTLSATRRQVTGGGLAAIGLIVAVAAIVIAALAMTRRFSWPNSGVDEVSRWHSWLVAHWSWLGRWS